VGRERKRAGDWEREFESRNGCRARSGSKSSRVARSTEDVSEAGRLGGAAAADTDRNAELVGVGEYKCTFEGKQDSRTKEG
jgi:hypothetical protein